MDVLEKKGTKASHSKGYKVGGKGSGRGKCSQMEAAVFGELRAVLLQLEKRLPSPPWEVSLQADQPNILQFSKLILDSSHA